MMPAGHVLPGFAPKHIEILQLLADGFTADEIGQRIGYSPHTVKGHVEDMRATLRARNRSHLVALAMQRGLID